MQTTPTDARTSEDVVDLLRAQHARIRDLFDEVMHSDGREREDAFRQLVRLLAIHETAEEEIIHPAARRLPGGDGIVDDRLAEEREAKELLSELDGMDIDDLRQIQAVVAGPPQPVAEYLQAYVEAGARHLVCRLACTGIDEYRRQLNLLAN